MTPLLRPPRLGLALASFAALLALFPIFYMLYVSLLDSNSILSRDPQFWPPRFDSFTEAWSARPFPRYFLNSMILSVAVAIGSTLTAIPAAYVFARVPFRGRDVLFALAVATLMIPSHVTLIPNYLTMAKLGLLDSYAGLALPFLANGFSIFLLRQHFKTIPREIDDAARMDGARPWRILRDMIAPLSWPAISTVALFAFVTEWNSFLWPLIATSSDDMRTLQIGLAHLYRQEQESGLIDWPLVMAGGLIVLAPTLIAFLLAERRLVRSVTLRT